MRLAVMQVAVVGSLVFLSFGVSVAEGEHCAEEKEKEMARFRRLSRELKT
jgi:hypothetical protein